MARVPSGRTPGVPNPRGEEGDVRVQQPPARVRQPIPAVTVVGRIDEKFAVRTSWDQTIHQISARQIKFLDELMGLVVVDDENNYVM